MAQQSIPTTQHSSPALGPHKQHAMLPTIRKSAPIDVHIIIPSLDEDGWWISGTIKSWYTPLTEYSL